MTQAIPLRILFVEDNPNDVELAVNVLGKEGFVFTYARVETEESFREALAEFKPDLVVSDYSMPVFDGLRALKVSLEHDPTLPFILLTGSLNEETAVDCVKAGATNYVVKEHISRLPYAVRDALEQKKAKLAQAETQRALRESEERFRALYSTSLNAILLSAPDGRILSANEAACQMFGRSEEELQRLGRDGVVDISDPSLEVMLRERELTGNVRGELTCIRADGEKFPVELSSSVFSGQDGQLRTSMMILDITERKLAEKALKESEERYRALFDQAGDAIFIHDAEGRILAANATACEHYGYTQVELQAMTVAKLETREQSVRVPARIARLMVLGKLKFETEHQKKDGTAIPVEVNARRITWNDRLATISICRNITMRKRLEKQLHDSLTALQVLFNASPLAIVSMDTAGKVTHWNPAAESMFGWLESEALGQYLPFVPEESREESRRLLERTLYNGGFTNVEAHRRKKDGSPIDINISTAPLHDAQGQVTGAMSVLTDITERKRMETELRFRLGFEALIAKISSSFIELNPESLDRLINDALKRLGEFARVDRSYIFLFSKDLNTLTNTHEWCAPGIESQIELLQDLKSDSVPWFVEKISALDCIHVPSVADLPPEAIKEKEFCESFKVKSIIVARMVSGNSITGFLGLDSVREEKSWSVEDIKVFKMIGEIFQTAIQQCRAEESRRLLETAIENTADYILITDNQGTIQYVNTAFEKITGFTRAEAVGRNPRILKSGLHNPVFYRNLWETLISKRDWRGHITNKKKDGTLYTEEATISPVCNPAGQITHFVSVKRDITQDQALENQLRQAQKMESIGQLAGGVAHDFNNLLTSILGYSSLLGRDSSIPEKTKKRIGEIEKAAQRGAEITSQLLTFSRKKDAVFKPVNLNAIITQTVGFLKNVIGPSYQTELGLEPDIVNIDGDSTQLQQVLMNLCLNSRDAMPGGGVISIKTRMSTVDDGLKFRYVVTKPGRYVVMEFSDNGCGMSKEVMDQIFEPFFTTKEVGKGTGLGMSIIYGIVKGHNGLINVYSEVGVGTIVKIYLPEGTVTESQVEVSAGPLPRGRETVLIVDDDVMVLNLAASILEDHGYTCLRAGDGLSGIEMLRQKGEEIGLVILDMIMPGLSGTETYQKMREVKNDLRAILSSGFHLENTGSLREMGFNEMVLKPYTARELTIAVRKVLDGEGEGLHEYTI